MSNQLQITGGAKVRNLNGVITGTTGVLGSVPLGAANGVATLDSSGKVPVSQLPASVVTYLGTWNAATNTPTLVNGTGDPGDLYICNVAGTVNFGAGPISFVVGDWVLYGSGTWQKSSGQNGTVTSVAVTETGDALTITGSPITTAGTINIGFAGTSAQYVAGNGSLITFPSLTGYVPYTGATGNVDLGEYELKAGQLSLDVSPTGTASVGTTRWNNTIGLSETTLKGGTVILKNGVDLVARIVNKVTPNTTLTKAAYQAVRVSGAQGQRLAVAFAQANNDNNSADTLGIVIETIPTNQEGFIMTVGQLEGVNTTGSLQGETWADGDVLYLSPTTPGALTNVKPTGLTGHIVVMGYVEYAHSSNGSIYVKIMNGWELDELHNVYISSPTNNQGLFYNSSNSLWENKSIATALGYTPADDSLVVKLAGTQNITGEKTFSSTYGITLDGNGTNSGSINFKLYNGASARGFGYSTIYSTNGNIFAFYYPIDSSNNSKQFKFNLSSLTTNTIRTYTMPDASGTLALTSDISGGTVTSVGLSSSTSGVTIGSTPITTSGTITLAIATASGSQQGLLSSTDWTTFNNKQNALTNPVTGTGTSNYLPKFTGTSTIGNSSIIDDASTVSAYTNAFRVFQIGGTGAAFYLSGNSTQATMAAITSAGAWQDLSIIGATLTFFSGTLGGLGSSLAMTINPSGNVSINNSNDTYKLDVSGTGRFTDVLNLASTSNQTKLSWLGYNSAYTKITSDVGYDSTYNGTYITNNTNAAGNAQGNTAIPSWALELGGGDSFKIKRSAAGSFSFSTLFNVASTGAATFSSSVTSSSFFNSNDGTRNVYLNPAADFGAGALPTIQVASNHALQFATNNALRLTIASTGAATFSSSVTAGTFLSAVSSNPYLLLNDTSGSAAGQVAFYSNGTQKWNLATQATSQDLGLYNNGGTNSFNLYIKYSTGNVGIGTSSPSGKFVVVGANANTFLNIDNVGGGEIYIGSNSFQSFQTAGSERMRITSGGALCVATTSPEYTATNRGNITIGGTASAIIGFQVNSVARGYLYHEGANIYMQNSGSGSIFITSGSNGVYLAQNATSWTSNSDSRLKNINSNIDNAVEKLMSLRTVNFSWKSDETNKENLGLIAQDVEKVFPQVIDKSKLLNGVNEQTDDTEYLGVRYQELVPVLIKAIQELKTEIDELKNK